MSGINWINVFDRIPPIATDVLVLNCHDRNISIGSIRQYPINNTTHNVLLFTESMPINYTDRIMFEATHWSYTPDKLDKSKWISIRDEPPEKEACVLFLDAYYTNEVFIGSIKDAHKCNVHGQFNIYRKLPIEEIYISEATHYQLLPTIQNN